MSPTARSLAYLRDRGYLAAVVERWIPRARQRVDLFGWIDLVGLDQTQNGLLGVQTTTQANAAARMAKLAALPVGGMMRRWLLAGNRLELHAWAKRGGRGERKTWSVHVRVVTLADLDGGPEKE